MASQKLTMDIRRTIRESLVPNLWAAGVEPFYQQVGAIGEKHKDAWQEEVFDYVYPKYVAPYLAQIDKLPAFVYEGTFGWSRYEHPYMRVVFSPELVLQIAAPRDFALPVPRNAIKLSAEDVERLQYRQPTVTVPVNRATITTLQHVAAERTRRAIADHFTTVNQIWHAWPMVRDWMTQHRSGWVNEWVGRAPNGTVTEAARHAMEIAESSIAEYKAALATVKAFAESFDTEAAYVPLIRATVDA